MKVINEVWKDISALIAKDFPDNHNVISGLLTGEINKGLLINWLQYQIRQVTQRKRNVLYTRKANKLRANHSAINEIERALKSGSDVRPWLSDSVRKKKEDPKADLMLNDWQIYHFHLGDELVRDDKIKRTPDLLFAHITPNSAYFVNVLPHNSWGMTSILKDLLDEFPETMARHEMKNVIEMNEFTDDEIVEARRNGVNIAMKLGNRFFMSPGKGIMISLHAMRIVEYADYMSIQLNNIIKSLQTDNIPEEILIKINSARISQITLGAIWNNGEFSIYDKASSIEIFRLSPLS